MKVWESIKHAWDAFSNNKYSKNEYTNVGVSYSSKPDRIRLSGGTEKTYVGPLYNRISVDVSAIAIEHIKEDEEGKYLNTIKSSLNECLTVEANIDQSGRALILDAVLSMFDEGCVAIVPVETSIDPSVSDAYNILSLRVGQILEWYPKHIRVRVYNEATGQKEELIIPKKVACIIENPLYSIMNEPNGTLKRLIAKLNLLDAIDNQSGSGKLDIIIQLPYLLKTEARKEAANIRRQELENQLTGSKYGIAYIDGTEKVTQLNRPAVNNLMEQITYLNDMLHYQLGITKTILDGTADEQTMVNYYNRTVNPIINAIVDEMRRKFLTKTARTQGQNIRAFRNPFELALLKDLAEIADKFTRNEILSSNDFRSIIGYRPSTQDGADELRNKNLNKPEISSEIQNKEEK
jgi:hypothetical protein